MADSFVIVYNVPPAPFATRYNLYFRPDTSAGAQPQIVAGVAGQIFVVPFWRQRVPVSTAKLYYQAQANDLPPAVVVANPSPFVPKFWPPEFVVLTDLWQGQAGDSPNPQDALTHFVPRFAQPKFNWRPYFTQANDVPPVVATGGNPHFVPRFWNPEITVLYDLFQGAAGDSPNPQDALTHFVPRFTAVKFNWRPYFSSANDQSTQTLQPETQPHFLGRFYAPQHALLAGLRQNVPLDPTFPVQPETNVHFLGRFSPPAHVVNRALRQTVAADQSTATPQPSTEPHFLGKHHAPTFNTLAALRQLPALDGPVAQETNTHFVAKLRPDQLRVTSALRMNAAVDVQADTNVHTTGRYTAPTHQLLRSLFGNIGNDQPIIIPSTPTHFVPRFSNPQHFVLPLLRAGTDYASSGPLPTQPETNVHFIAKYADAVFDYRAHLLSIGSAPFATFASVAYIRTEISQAIRPSTRVV